MGTLDERFQYTWERVKLHTAHRTSMFNFLLLASSVLAVAFVEAQKIQALSRHAWLIGVLGASVAIWFHLLDLVTLQKIQNGKQLLIGLLGEEEPTINTIGPRTLAESLGSTKQRFDEGYPLTLVRWLPDPAMTTLVESSIAGAFSFGAALPWFPSPIPGLIAAGIAVALFVFGWKTAMKIIRLGKPLSCDE